VSNKTPSSLDPAAAILGIVACQVMVDRSREGRGGVFKLCLGLAQSPPEFFWVMAWILTHLHSLITFNRYSLAFIATRRSRSRQYFFRLIPFELFLRLADTVLFWPYVLVAAR
jgi:hypothetical protein